MNDNIPNQFITGEPQVSSNIQYCQWIENVKSRYRQSQIKAHLQVNASAIEFNWSLGHDISEIQRTKRWGAGVVNQASLDLKAAFPEAQGFSKDNLYRMARFYRFYTEEKEFVSQLVRQLQPSEAEDVTKVAQVASEGQSHHRHPHLSESQQRESGMDPGGHQQALGRSHLC